MDFRLHLSLAVLLTLCVVHLGGALSIPTETEHRQTEVSENTNDAEKRATWMETRELEGQFKELVYSAITKLVEEGRMGKTVLTEEEEAKVKRTRGRRWQGFCFRKTRRGQFLPYICWKSGRK